MKKLLIILFISVILFLPNIIHADYLGCYEPNATVSGATLDIDTITQPTSPSAKVYAPNDTTTPTATPTLSAVDATGAIGQFRLADFSVGASPVYGTWTIRYIATTSDSVVHHGTDTFDVRATCPLKPTVAGRTSDIDSSGRVLLQPTQTGVTIPTVTTLTNAPSLTTADKQQLGVIKQITASGAGNTTTIIESSNLSETDSKAYVGNLINCAGATNAANKVVTLKIIKFDPTTDRITLGGVLPAALTVGDTCNILMDTLR